jgi:DNA-binding beta-propeller fold protein YncE
MVFEVAESVRGEDEMTGQPRRIGGVAIGLILGIALLLGNVSVVPMTWAQGTLFVSNYNGNSITVYPRTVNGDVPPDQVYPTDNPTGVHHPHQIAISQAARELFVANNDNDVLYSIAVLDLDTGVLKRTIAGTSTGLNRPTGVAVDEVNAELYVANDFGNSITVYDLTADGNVAPKRTIQGGATKLGQPVGVAVDTVNNELFVANYGVASLGSITVYPRTANGDVVPKRTIQGGATELNLPQGLALDLGRNEIVVASSAFTFPNPGPGAILGFSRTADGNVAPIRRLEGLGTRLCNPIGLVLDLADGELVVANSAFSGLCEESVTVYAWPTYAVGQVPLRTLVGSGVVSELANPTGVTISPPVGKTVSIGPSSMEGAIKISNGDWVNGGYSLKSTVTGVLTVVAKVTITGPCSNGGTDTVTVPLATKAYTNPAGQSGWLPTGDANSILSWQGSVRVGVNSPAICGGVGKLDASKGAVFTATVSANPPQPNSTVTFRFKFRDPAAKGKPNTNCLDPYDPNRNKADVCGAPPGAPPRRLTRKVHPVSENRGPARAPSLFCLKEMARSPERGNRPDHDECGGSLCYHDSCWGKTVRDTERRRGQGPRGAVGPYSARRRRPWRSRSPADSMNTSRYQRAVPGGQ